MMHDSRYVGSDIFCLFVCFLKDIHSALPRSFSCFQHNDNGTHCPAPPLIDQGQSKLGISCLVVCMSVYLFCVCAGAHRPEKQKRVLDL